MRMDIRIIIVVAFRICFGGFCDLSDGDIDNKRKRHEDGERQEIDKEHGKIWYMQKSVAWCIEIGHGHLYDHISSDTVFVRDRIKYGQIVLVIKAVEITDQIIGSYCSRIEVLKNQKSWRTAVQYLTSVGIDNSDLGRNISVDSDQLLKGILSAGWVAVYLIAVGGCHKPAFLIQRFSPGTRQIIKDHAAVYFRYQYERQEKE